MLRLIACIILSDGPDGIASTAWDYTGFLCNLYSLQSSVEETMRDDGPNAATAV